MGGREFPQLALQYAKELKSDMDKHEQGFSTPLSRFEPRVVMLDFIRWLLENGYGKYQNRINDSLYLGKTPNDGDNSDNGHWIIDLEKLEFVHTKGEYESEFEPEEE